MKVSKYESPIVRYVGNLNDVAEKCSHFEDEPSCPDHENAATPKQSDTLQDAATTDPVRTA